MSQPVNESSPQAAGRWRLLIAGLVLLVLLAVVGVKLFARLSAPPDVQRIYRIGLEAMQQGDLARVQVAAEALAGLDDAVPQLHLLAGIVHLRSGRLQEAVAEFREALEHPQTAALANMLAGEALYRNRQFHDALGALQAAAQRDPSLTDAHRRLAALLYDIGSSEAAVAELRLVSQQAPDDPRPHRMLGLIYKDMESYEPAIAEYREALRRDPHLSQRDEVLSELASCLLKARRYEEFAEIAAQCPRSADTLAMQAEAQFEQADSTAAAALVEQAVQLAPDHLESLLMKGTIELSQGDVAEAAETLGQAAREHPTDYRVHHKLAQAYTRLGQLEQARASTQEAERLRNLRSRFADLHARASVDTGDAELRYQLGVMARELGREDLAISWFAAATALDANHAAAREALQTATAAASDTTSLEAPPGNQADAVPRP